MRMSEITSKGEQTACGPKTVRAKFKCSSVLQWEGPGRKYEFTAVVDKANESWSKYTPSGNVTIMIDNPACPPFIPGKQYYLDITPVEDK